MLGYGQCFGMQSDMDTGDAPDIRADLVWSQSDGLREEIFFSSYKDGEWKTACQVTDDNADNLHPSIDQTSDATRWIAWTAVEDGVYSIQARSVRGEQLGEVKTISTGLPMNIYPTVIVDRTGVVWIVWSGNQGNNDDIFFSRLVGGVWQHPRPVHPANQVPDIQPAVSLASDGMPLVRWQRFVAGSYRQVESHWRGRTWSPVRMVTADEDKMEQKQRDAAWKMALKKSRPDSMANVQSEFLKIY